MSNDAEVAFITGGGGAIGCGIAKACLDRGWRVALADISEDAMTAAVAKLGAPADRLVAIKLDVRDPDDWQRAADEAASTVGEVTYLFNNAGVTSGRSQLAGGNIETLSVEEWRWTIAINLDGVFFGLKTFVPRFKNTSRPTHINTTASMAAVAALKTALPVSYPATKAAVAHMAAQLRTELAMQNISSIGISVLYPNVIRSNILRTSFQQSPDRQLGDADESQFAYGAIGADPELLGQYVLRAIDRGDFHIFPDADWRDLIHDYRTEVDESFKGKADPSFDDPAKSFVDLAHVSVAQGRTGT